MKTTCLIISSIIIGAAPAVAQSIFSGGHGDIGVALEDDFLHLHAHLHSGAIVDGAPLAEDGEFDAADLSIVVPNATRQTVGIAIPAAGVDVGDQLWILPQNNPGVDTIPFLGLGTEDLVAAQWPSGITLTLQSVTSPSGAGTFSFWQTSFFGGLDFYFSSSRPELTVNGNNSIVLAAGVHDHVNWAFTETGEWQIQLQASGMHSGLGVLTDIQTFHFSVIPEPSSLTALAGLSTLLWLVGRQQSRRS